MAELTLAIYAVKSIYDIIHSIQVMIEEVKFNKDRCQELAKMVLRVETVLRQHEGNDLCNTEKYTNALRDIENTLVESRELIQNHIEKSNFKRMLKRRDYEFAFENLRRKIHEGISLLNLAITYRIHSMVNELVEHARRPPSAAAVPQPSRQQQQQVMQQQLQQQLSEMSLIQQQIDKLDEGPEDDYQHYHQLPHPPQHHPSMPAFPQQQQPRSSFQHVAAPPFFNDGGGHEVPERDPQEIINECKAMSEKLKAVMQGEEVDDEVLAELVRLNSEMIDLNQRQRQSLHVAPLSSSSSSLTSAPSFSRPLPTPPGGGVARPLPSVVGASTTSPSPHPAMATTTVSAPLTSSSSSSSSSQSQHLPDLFGERPEKKEEKKKGSKLGSFLHLSKDKDKKRLQREKDFAALPNEPLKNDNGTSNTVSTSSPPSSSRLDLSPYPARSSSQPLMPQQHYTPPVEEPLPPMRIYAPPSLKSSQSSLPSINTSQPHAALHHQTSSPSISPAASLNLRPNPSVAVRNSFQQQPSGPSEVSFLEVMGGSAAIPKAELQPTIQHQPQASSYSPTPVHQSSLSLSGEAHKRQSQYQPQHQTSIPFTAVHTELSAKLNKPQSTSSDSLDAKWTPPDMRYPGLEVSFADAPLQIFGSEGIKQTTLQNEVGGSSTSSARPQSQIQQAPQVQKIKTPQELNIERMQEIYFGGLQLSPEVASKMIDLYEIDLIHSNQPQEALLQGVTSFISSLQVAFRNADPEDKGVLCSAQELHLAFQHASFNHSPETTMLLYRKYALQEPSLKYMMTIMDFLNSVADICLTRNKFHWADQDGDGYIRLSFNELVSIALSQTTTDLL